MNLKMVKQATLAHGTLQLRVYDLHSYLTIIPEEPGEPIYKRSYTYDEEVKAQQDYEAIRKVAQA